MSHDFTPIEPSQRGTPEVVTKTIDLAGGTAAVQKHFGFKTHQAVRRWIAHGVPDVHVRDLCRLTGHRVKPIDLRPDLYDLEKAELP